MYRLLLAHTTPVETVFTVISLLTLGISIYALRDAHIDSAILSAAKVNGPRRAIADNNIHQEQLRFGISIVMVLASASFMFLEPPPPDYVTLPQSLVGLIAWILVSFMVMVSTLSDKSIRKKLQQYAPIEVQTQTRIMPAPIRADGHQSHTPEADVMKAALDARAEQLVEDEANHQHDGGKNAQASGQIPVVVTPNVASAKTLVQALAVQTEIQELAVKTETLAEETCASAAETTKAIGKHAEQPPKDAA